MKWNHEISSSETFLRRPKINIKKKTKTLKLKNKFTCDTICDSFAGDAGGGKYALFGAAAGTTDWICPANWIFSFDISTLDGDCADGGGPYTNAGPDDGCQPDDWYGPRFNDDTSAKQMLNEQKQINTTNSFIM